MAAIRVSVLPFFPLSRDKFMKNSLEILNKWEYDEMDGHMKWRRSLGVYDWCCPKYTLCYSIQSISRYWGWHKTSFRAAQNSEEPSDIFVRVIKLYKLWIRDGNAMAPFQTSTIYTYSHNHTKINWWEKLLKQAAENIFSQLKKKSHINSLRWVIIVERIIKCLFVVAW